MQGWLRDHCMEVVQPAIRLWPGSAEENVGKLTHESE